MSDNVLDHATEAGDHAAPDLTPPVGRSLVDRIRERHAQRKPYIERPIPQWDGDVVVRYGRIPKKVIAQATKRRLSALASNAELLVAACQEVFVRDDAGDLRPASEADGMPAPVRFDGRLAELFDLRGAAPRDIAIAMYGDDLAIGKDAQRILDWQTGGDLDDLDVEEVEDDLGEVPAAT